jgi:hypothetical protein
VHRPCRPTQPAGTSRPDILEEAHQNLHISPEKFDAVAAELARVLDFLNVPEWEKEEVLGVFAASLMSGHRRRLRQELFLDLGNDTVHDRDPERVPGQPVVGLVRFD